MPYISAGCVRGGVRLLVVCCLLATSTIFAPALPAHAADLLLSPASSRVTVGEAVRLQIVVSTPDEAMNAVEGVLTFPPELLEVVTLAKEPGIIGFWIRDPTYANSAGTLQFEGIALNPGYQGSFGTILTVVLRAKAAGQASLSFSGVEVLANDGSGTSILDGTRGAVLAISEPVQEPQTQTPEPEPVSPATGATLALTSPSHPDQDAWYTRRDAILAWDVSPGISAVRTLIDRTPTSDPSVVYEPPIAEKIVRDLDDGVWYFHADARSAEGWGPTSHYRLQIDTTPPILDVERAPRDDPTDPRIRLTVSAEDQHAGVKELIYAVDGGAPQEIEDTAVATEPLAPGEHHIRISATDHAGLVADEVVAVTIEPLVPPTIDNYAREISRGGSLWVRGRSDYAGGTITLALAPADGDDQPLTYTTQVEDDGRFALSTSDIPARGTYSLSAKVTDRRGAQSSWTQVGDVTIAADELSAGLVLAIAGILFLLALIVLGIVALVVWRRRDEAHRAVHAARRAHAETMRLLKEDAAGINEAASRAHRGKPTKKEQEALDRLTGDLAEADGYLEQQLEAIERALGR